MKTLVKLALVLAALLLSTASGAQTESLDDREDLKMAALEALISAPASRALPLVKKVLDGNHSSELKERALFILSQIDTEEAQSMLIKFANGASGELQLEAIRMIGIGGNHNALANLKSVYETGTPDAREAVLEAYMIAGDKAAVFEIATNAEGEDFDRAVDMLGVMGAREELRELRSRTGASETLIQAYAISGDFESLRELASDSSSVELQTQAIEALGIIGGERVNDALVDIYRTASSDDVREAALQGMLISGHDSGPLELYRASDDPVEKKELLKLLVIMGSDDVWEVIDSALEGGE